MENLDMFFYKDRYICYNEYKNLCEKNNLEINDDILNERNNNFIDRKLIEYK